MEVLSLLTSLAMHIQHCLNAVQQQSITDFQYKTIGIPYRFTYQALQSQKTCRKSCEQH